MLSIWTLQKLRHGRCLQLDDALFYLQVAEDNGYHYSEDGRGEIRYSQAQAARARRSIRRIDAAIERRSRPVDEARYQVRPNRTDYHPQRYPWMVVDLADGACEYFHSHLRAAVECAAEFNEVSA